MARIAKERLDRLRAQEHDLNELMAVARRNGDEQAFQEALGMLGQVGRLIDEAERDGKR